MKGVTPIPMLTAYSAPVARSLESAGIPVILVGDTVGTVEVGFDSTCHTTMEHMQCHVGAVRRGIAVNTRRVGSLRSEEGGDTIAARRDPDEVVSNPELHSAIL